MTGALVGGFLLPPLGIPLSSRRQSPVEQKRTMRVRAAQKIDGMLIGVFIAAE